MIVPREEYRDSLVELIALQQPVASALRFAVASFEIPTDSSDELIY